jgi:hypothetical protein
MQDDEGLDRGAEIARVTGQPFYVGYMMADGTICGRDETMRFPDKPEGCYETYRAEQKSRRYRENLRWALKQAFGH